MATLVESFTAALGREVSDPEGFEATLADAVAHARAAWPGVVLAPELFVAHLASRVPEGELADAAVSRLQLADLYLACACARGVAGAIAAFDARHFADLGAALTRMRFGDTVLDEIKQQLRVQLFVADGDELPDIALYGGRAPLGLWVRSVGVRAALKILRRDRRLVPDGEQALLALAAEDDPALAHLKRTYAREFKAAFADAVAALTVRQRNLLRHHLVDALTIDAVGRLYRIHRATAARWLAAAREELMGQTTKLLRARLALDAAEVDSIVRMVRSQLDLSVYRLLDGGEPDDE